MLNKVPEATGLFWIVKIFTTGAGETSSDFLVGHLDPVIGVAIGLVGLIAALVLQFRVRRYIPAVYWFAVVMVSIFGTMFADVLHAVIGVPYLVSAPAFAALLALVFILWRRSEGTLSIHSITTRRREVFYWSAVLSTFALGTATGDMTASALHFGYLPSGILFAVIIAIPAVGFAVVRRYGILAFWFAYVVTRPLGASFADWMGVSPHYSGLGWGTGPVSLVLLVLIAVLVVVLSIRQSPPGDSPRRDEVGRGKRPGDSFSTVTPNGDARVPATD